MSKRNRIRGPFNVAMPLVLVLLIIGCATTATRWRETSRANTITAYENFLQNHPDSEWAPEARKCIDDLAFAEAKRLDTVAALDSYRGRFPSGSHHDDALAECEAIMYRATMETTEPAPCRAYLERFSQHERAEEMRRHLDDRIFEVAVREGKATGYEQYVKDFPEGRHIQESEQALATIVYEALENTLRQPGLLPEEGIRASQVFLQDHRDSPHAVKVRDSMTQLEQRLATDEEEAYRQANSSRSAAVVLAFLDRFGQGRHGAVVQQYLNSHFEKRDSQRVITWQELGLSGLESRTSAGTGMRATGEYVAGGEDKVVFLDSGTPSKVLFEPISTGGWVKVKSLDALGYEILNWGLAFPVGSELHFPTVGASWRGQKFDPDAVAVVLRDGIAVGSVEWVWSGKEK